MPSNAAALPSSYARKALKCEAEARSASHAFCYRTILPKRLTLLLAPDAGPSRADTEPRWGNKFVPSSSGGGFEDRDRGGGFGDRDRASSRGEDTWGRRPSDGEPPAAGGEALLPQDTTSSTCSQHVRRSPLSQPPSTACPC